MVNLRVCKSSKKALLPAPPFLKAHHLPPLLPLPFLPAPHCCLHLPSPPLNTNRGIFLCGSILQLPPGYLLLFRAMTFLTIPSSSTHKSFDWFQEENFVATNPLSNPFFLPSEPVPSNNEFPQPPQDSEALLLGFSFTPVVFRSYRNATSENLPPCDSHQLLFINTVFSCLHLLPQNSSLHFPQCPSNQSHLFHITPVMMVWIPQGYAMQISITMQH